MDVPFLRPRSFSRASPFGALSLPLAFLLALALIQSLTASVANGVTINFDVRPDGTPIQNVSGCGEIEFDTFRPWGVLFGSADGLPLDIRTTLLEKCGFSRPNALGHCLQDGVIDITFVLPNTDVRMAVDRIAFTVFTGTHAEFHAKINTYDASGMLLDSWVFRGGGFCREPPFFVDGYDFPAPGRIARVECILLRVGIDDVRVTESTTPVDGTTWGQIKAFY